MEAVQCIGGGGRGGVSFEQVRYFKGPKSYYDGWLHADANGNVC